MVKKAIFILNIFLFGCAYMPLIDNFKPYRYFQAGEENCDTSISRIEYYDFQTTQDSVSLTLKMKIYQKDHKKVENLHIFLLNKKDTLPVKTIVFEDSLCFLTFELKKKFFHINSILIEEDSCKWEFFEKKLE